MRGSRSRGINPLFFYREKIVRIFTIFLMITGTHQWTPVDNKGHFNADLLFLKTCPIPILLHRIF